MNNFDLIELLADRVTEAIHRAAMLQAAATIVTADMRYNVSGRESEAVERAVRMVKALSSQL